jgi:hypothetical protein
VSQSPNKHDATRPPDASPPEKLTSLIGDYPGLAIVAGLGLGVLVSALLPRHAGRKLAKGAVFVATAAGEVGLALGKQALEKADDATRDGREILSETAADAGRLAADAGRKASKAAQDAGHNAQRLAGDATTTARDLGLALARKAVDAASRLRH